MDSGFMCGYAPSCIPAAFQYRRELEQQHDELVVSLEIQQYLNQINMEMNIEDGDFHFDFLTNSFHATGGYSFPSTPSSFRSALLSCSPEISSTGSLPHGGAGLLSYDDQYVANFDHTPAGMARGGMSSTSAFRRYERNLGPQRRLTKPACGQRMFRTAMSVLPKMHRTRRYIHQQQQQAAPSGNQLQRIISERKRREKLNDSFHALKSVLPPGSKKLGQASILIVAREYVNSLKSMICELEEKNQALQLLLPPSSEQEGATKSRGRRAPPDQGGLRGEGSYAGAWQHDEQDVTLVSMNTSEDGDRPAQRASLTLHIKVAPVFRNSKYNQSD